MFAIHFRQAVRNAHLPLDCGKSGYLLFPAFCGDHLTVRSGETISLDLGVICEMTEGCALTLFDAGLSEHSPLLLHSAVFTDGERIKVRLTNTSDKTCALVAKAFDEHSRIGHGIYRNAVILSGETPVARGLLTPVCQSDTDSEGYGDFICDTSSDVVDLAEPKRGAERSRT